MTLSKIDKAITTVNFLLKKKKRRADDMGRKVDVTENQKIFIGEELDLIRNVEVLVKAAKHDFNAQMGKLPPQDTEMEEAVLGAVILESSSEAIYDIVEGKHFYLEAHQLIWKAIIELRVANKPVDLRTVVSQLRKSGHLETVGGATKVAAIVTKVSSGANAEHHARVLIEMAIKRQLILMAGKILSEAYEDTSDCFDLLEIAEDEVKEIKTWIK